MYKVSVDIEGAKTKSQPAPILDILSVFCERFMDETFEMVKLRTPGTGVVRGKWECRKYFKKVDGVAVLERAEIVNTYQPEMVVHILEGGSVAHQIWSTKVHDLLVFDIDPIDREILGAVTAFISTKKEPVQHPGTKPYKMIEESHRELVAKLVGFPDLFAEEIARLMAHGSRQ